MVAVIGGLGSEFSIVTPHKPSDMFLIPFSTGFLSELKMVTSFFLKIAEQFESHSCPIERRLAIFKFGYVWSCLAIDGKIGRGRCPEFFD